MSKKNHPETVNEEESRRSRKEVLIAQKEAEQTRGIRIAMGIVAGLILLNARCRICLVLLKQPV